MGLGSLVPETPGTVLPKDVALAAQEVLPEFFTKGRDAPTYREHLLESYRQRDGCPARRDDNGQYRTPDETRLDRAWTDVADRMDRSEGDIRSCVLDIYDGPGEFENMPARLRSDFNEILERAEDRDQDE